MVAQRRRDTVPEVEIRRRLHALGYRYRVDYRWSAARTRIDIAFLGQKLAVFVDGCYWHACPIHATQPKSNAEWWAKKLLANAARDRRADAALRDAGWQVIRAWEHERPADVVGTVVHALRKRAVAHYDQDV